MIHNNYHAKEYLKKDAHQNFLSKPQLISYLTLYTVVLRNEHYELFII